MTKKKNEKQQKQPETRIMPPLDITTNDQGIPGFRSKAEYQHDLSIAKQVEAKAKKMKADSDFSVRDIRNTHALINKGNRAIDSKRRAYRRKYMAPFKPFNQLIKALEEPLSNAADILNGPLKDQHKQRIEKLKSHLAPIMDGMCKRAGVKQLPVPDSCLKLSLSKMKRLKIMSDIIHAETGVERIQNSVAVGDKAVNKDTGEVTGNAYHFALLGNESQLKDLKKLAEKNGMVLQFMPVESKK